MIILPADSELSFDLPNMGAVSAAVTGEPDVAEAVLLEDGVVIRAYAVGETIMNVTAERGVHTEHVRVIPSAEDAVEREVWYRHVGIGNALTGTLSAANLPWGTSPAPGVWVAARPAATLANSVWRAVRTRRSPTSESTDFAISLVEGNLVAGVTPFAATVTAAWAQEGTAWDATASVTATGGTPPYTFTWIDAGDDLAANPLGVGRVLARRAVDSSAGDTQTFRCLAADAAGRTVIAEATTAARGA